MSVFSIRTSASAIGFMVYAIDFLAVYAGGWTSYLWRFSSESEMRYPHEGEGILMLGMAAFSTLFFGWVYRMWPMGGSLATTVGRVTLSWLIAWATLMVLLVLTKSAESFSRIWLVSWLLIATVLLWMGRISAFFILTHMRRAGYHLKKVILYGNPKMLAMVKTRIGGASWSGYEIVSSVLQEDGTVLGKLDAELKPDEIWISLSMPEQVQIEEVMFALRHSVANIRLLPDLMLYKILNHGMSIMAGIPMVDISISPMFGSRKIVKAIQDYTVATLALLIFSPLMIVIAIAIKVTSKGPVLFRQKRHGWNNSEIWVYKFRSMVVHQETYGSVTQAQRGDRRVTPLGSFLRKSSLDELPQFINVLQGRMSVVGPRPHALKHNYEYVALIPKYALRHKVKPGITGWAQVSGCRGETDTLDKMESRVAHDIFYLENWSLWMDLKIIAMTPLATILNKNVY